MTNLTAVLEQYLKKWQDVLRLRDWDIRLRLVDTDWRKTGDIKIDLEDKKAILLFNERNPKQANPEEIVIHELLHLKLYALDQMLEQLLEGVFGSDESDPRYDFASTQFMVALESTVEDLTKSFLTLGGQDKTLSFGRVQKLVDEELGASSATAGEQDHGTPE